MKSLKEYIIEQLLLEKGHIANKEEISSIAKTITDFCVSEYSGEVADSAYDFEKGSFFYDKLKFIKVQFNHYKSFTACVAVYTPQLDSLLNLEQFEKKYEISGYNAKYYVLQLNIDKMPDYKDKQGIEQLYGAIAHEMTHLYQFLNGMSEHKDYTNINSDKEKLEYLLDSSEMEARINQMYHLIMKKWGENPQDTKELMDDITETEFIHDIVKGYKDIDKATQLSQTEKLLNDIGTEKQKKIFDKFKKKLFRVAYDAMEEILNNDK